MGLLIETRRQNALPDYLSLKDVMRSTGLSRRALMALRDKNEVVILKIGGRHYVDRQSLNAWTNRRRLRIGA